MTLPSGRLDDADDYVSMHHRIRKDLRRRLKHLSADIEKPVTDIVNDAIMAHLDNLIMPSDLPSRSAKDILDALRKARANGTFYGTVATLDKANLLEISRLLGEAADPRSSGDRLVARIAAALSP